MFTKTDKKIYSALYAFITVMFFLFPFGVKAATTIYFDLENPVIYEGDIFLADLKISAPDVSINVVEGTVLYDSDKLEIQEISTGGSLLALWPNPPVFSNKQGNLSFVGGVIDGFRGEKGKVLRIIFRAKSEGEAQINFLDGFSVFLHDGRGTQVSPLLSPLSLNILERPPDIAAKDEWQDLVKQDKTPPEPFGIDIGKDLSVFDNQYFISFFTTDAESGVAYYEVKEGDGDFVRTESPYVLRDQSLRSLITIKAVDKAGNERIAELMPSAPLYENILVWVGILLVVFVIGSLYWIWKRKG